MKSKIQRKMYMFKYDKINDQVLSILRENFIASFKDKTQGVEAWKNLKNSKKIKYKDCIYSFYDTSTYKIYYGSGLNKEIIMEIEHPDIVSYIMLHKNKEILSFNIYKSRYIIGNGKVINYNELPPLLQVKESNIEIPDDYLNEWLEQRGIRLNKLHYDRLVKQLKLDDKLLRGIDTKGLVIRTNALSLNDCYWIKPTKSNLKWEEVNFFTNDFDVAINKLYCDTLKDNQVYNFKGTPNNTTQGQLRKVWEIENGKRILFKKSNGITKTDVVNEKVVSDYLDLCEIDHIKYTIREKYNGLGSFCENACNENLEFISFNDYISNNFNINLSEQENINNFINKLSKNNSQLRSDFENMILIDILFSNTDRHWGNFGFLRDVNTLKIVKTMPIFDNGFCLMGSEPDDMFKKYFDDTEARRSKLDSRLLFDNFDYLTNKFNPNILKYMNSLKDIITKNYSDFNISKERIDLTLKFLQKNIVTITTYFKNKQVK